MRLGRGLAGIALAISVAGAAAAQPAPECARAKTPAEKAICGDPKLRDADAAMSRAYAALKSALPQDQQAALLADQRQWVARRDRWCSDKQGPALDACLWRETETRRRFLAGEGPNVAPDAPHLVPAFFHEARKGRYEISIAYPRLSEGGAEPAFARAVAVDGHAVYWTAGDGTVKKMAQPPPAPDPSVP